MNKSCVFKHQFKGSLKLPDLSGNYFVTFTRSFKEGSCPRKTTDYLLKCNIPSSILFPDNPNPALSGLGCMLQQELETWELYAGNLWDVDEQNVGWYYLDGLVNKQIWLIKAGRPQRFLHTPPFAWQLWGIRFLKRPGWKLVVSGVASHVVQLLVTGT